MIGGDFLICLAGGNRSSCRQAIGRLWKAAGLQCFVAAGPGGFRAGDGTRNPKNETRFISDVIADSPKWWSGFGQRFRRRDAGGCGRDDRAPGKAANDRGMR
jgi:hypothetical protein